MARDTMMPSPGNVFADLGISEPDIELAKADLAIRIQRLAEHRRLTGDEAAALLRVPKSDLPVLFQGRLATCSLDQLLRMLTWLGDDVEILIRPRVHRTKRGALRVLQATAVEKPDDFGPARERHAKRSRTSTALDTFPEDNGIGPDASSSQAPRDDRQLLDKHAVEKMTSLDITTIYRKMVAGTFPQPVKVGRRRVAWLMADIMRWQRGLKVGTERPDRITKKSAGSPETRGGRRRRH
jgi:predicted DNA-binding transcriptional regulator AlpA/predicted XRE-type DNA-binding protein